jgi:predicted RNA-binding Zn-ribbon protein involved in translation (DUF1610 family)
MAEGNFTEDIALYGEFYDYDPKQNLVLYPCENCGHLNAVELQDEGGEKSIGPFACENCGHWNEPG